MAELLAEVAEDASFEARETGHSIECEGIEACVVTGDAAMLRSCCENIVRNALLHTPAGTVVRMGIEREAGDAVVWMEDDGPGVAEEALGHLCELFYRAGAAAETHPDGTGFGLAIAQRIVAMHGGVLSARNLVPHGLGIRISLPVAGDLS